MNYITLRNEAGAELVEKKSRFIAKACPVSTEQEALDFLENIRAQNRTASHNVFAYRLRERNLSRYSDDGEPSGTAGLPVLDILERADITDAIIVVTRYFGGTLLGTGGLVRAYSGAAGKAAEAAGIVTMEESGMYDFTCGYPEYERTVRILREAGAEITTSEFLDQVRISYIANAEKEAMIEPALRELSRGKSAPVLIETDFFPSGE